MGHYFRIVSQGLCQHMMVVDWWYIFSKKKMFPSFLYNCILESLEKKMLLVFDVFAYWKVLKYF